MRNVQLALLSVPLGLLTTYAKVDIRDAPDIRRYFPYGYILLYPHAIVKLSLVYWHTSPQCSYVSVAYSYFFCI